MHNTRATTLGGSVLNDVLCQTCNVLLCILEQLRVYNFSLVPLKFGALLEAIGPVVLRPCKRVQYSMLLKVSLFIICVCTQYNVG